MFNLKDNDNLSFFAGFRILAKSVTIAFVKSPFSWLYGFAVSSAIAFTFVCVRPALMKNFEDALPVSKAYASTAHSFSMIEMPHKTGTQMILDELEEKQRVIDWIVGHYPVSRHAANLYVSTAFKTGSEMGLDPHMLVAVMAVESKFNPRARSHMGAEGIMQVMANVHADKFRDYGGVTRVLDPEVNIKVGAIILKDYLKRTGSVRKALKHYVGAADFSHDFGYGKKVLDIYKSLKKASGTHKA